MSYHCSVRDLQASHFWESRRVQKGSLSEWHGWSLASGHHTMKDTASPRVHYEEKNKAKQNTFRILKCQNTLLSQTQIILRQRFLEIEWENNATCYHWRLEKQLFKTWTPNFLQSLLREVGYPLLEWWYSFELNFFKYQKTQPIKQQQQQKKAANNSACHKGKVLQTNLPGFCVKKCSCWAQNHTLNFPLGKDSSDSKYSIVN